MAILSRDAVAERYWHIAHLDPMSGQRYRPAPVKEGSNRGGLKPDRLFWSGFVEPLRTGISLAQ
jgi:hypothetical protein